MASDARFIVRPAAEVDVAESALWYESRSFGLGADFLRAVDVCFSDIQRSPDGFQNVYRQARKARLRRFPYAVYFVATATEIRVVACMHAKRDPREWQQRVDQ